MTQSACQSPPVQLGAVGVALQVLLFETDPSTGVRTPTDLTGATLPKVHLEKPDGTKVAHDAQVLSPPALGLIEYRTAAAADLDQPGTWRIQGEVSLPSGFQGRTAIGEFLVAANL